MSALGQGRPSAAEIEPRASIRWIKGRAYADMGAWAKWGGRRHEPLVASGEITATWDPNTAAIFFAERLTELRGKRAANQTGVPAAASDVPTSIGAFIGYHLAAKADVKGRRGLDQLRQSCHRMRVPRGAERTNCSSFSLSVAPLSSFFVPPARVRITSCDTPMETGVVSSQSVVALLVTGACWHVSDSPGRPLTLAGPSRKSDVKDAERIADQRAHELIRTSFVPPTPPQPPDTPASRLPASQEVARGLAVAMNAAGLAVWNGGAETLRAPPVSQRPPVHSV
jgi:hypothetical protein